MVKDAIWPVHVGVGRLMGSTATAPCSAVNNIVLQASIEKTRGYDLMSLAPPPPHYCEERGLDKNDNSIDPTRPSGCG